MDYFPFKDVAILQHGPALYAIQQRAPLIVRSREEALTMPWWRREYAEDVEHGPSEAFDAKGFIAVPFGYQGACNAALMLIYDRAISPAEGEMQLLGAFADHAAVALHNTRLYGQAQQAAALEERHRLARDLHDSVTQSLFSMSLLAQAIPPLFAINPQEATNSLGELQRLSKEALAEMRALLFQLRPVALEEDGLVEALTKQVALLQRRDGPAAHLRGDRQRPTCGCRLPDRGGDLFRVASEGGRQCPQAPRSDCRITRDRHDRITVLDGAGRRPRAIDAGRRSRRGAGPPRPRRECASASRNSGPTFASRARRARARRSRCA